MHQRIVAVTVLGLALLFSQGGNFLVAALCPHLQSGMATCQAPSVEPAKSHEGMAHDGHAGMDHETQPAPEPDPNTFVVSQSDGPCAHCAVHSGTTPRSASLRDAAASSRSSDLNVPLQLSRVAPVTESAVAVLSSRAHGPPGQGPARYILINSFRI